MITVKKETIKKNEISEGIDYNSIDMVGVQPISNVPEMGK